MKISKKRLPFWKLLGPGLITGASDDDPSGIATYSQAGAAFGLATLWTAFFTFPLMAAIQGMCARIGLVTSAGLSGALKKSYPKSILYLMLIFSFPAIILNIGADIAGMGAVANLLSPAIPTEIYSVFITLLLIVSIIVLPYRKIASILKWLCVTLLCYLIVPFLMKQNFLLILKNMFVPNVRFTKEYLGILVGILGTTISPYLFFWQASMEVEEVTEKKIIVDKQIIGEMKVDVNVGTLFSNVVMFFIILTTGTVLFNAGIHKIDTVEQAAQALKPLAGNFSYLLFALGVIGTGLLAIPVLAGSLSYMITETFGWEQGLNKKFHEAKAFYYIIIVSLVVALAINFTGMSPIQSLIYTAILYGITAPVLIAIILHISNNKKVMGKHINSTLSNVMGFLTLLLMTAAAVVLLYLQFIH